MRLSAITMRLQILRLLRRIAALLPRSDRHRVALAWAALTVAVAAATAPAVGISRDESVYFVAAESYAAWWKGALTAPRSALASLDNLYGVNHEHPGLAKGLYGLSHALLTGAGLTSHAEGFRFGAFLLAGFLSYLLALFGRDLAGRGGALLAPALFWLVPRHFYHAHPAVLDMPTTALWLATVYAYRRSLEPSDRRTRLRRAVATGLAFGAAISVKHNGWFLPPLLFVHFLLARGSSLKRATARERLPAIPLAFLAMAVIGPLVFLATWPWLWHDGLARFADYVRFHLGHENYPWYYLGTMLREPPFPIAYPFVVTALTVPAAVLAAMAGGFAQALVRLVLALRGRGEDVSTSDEWLLLLNALFPIALIAIPTVPHFGGVKHWMPAMPFLALLGARALVWAGRTLWPARAAAITGALALFTLTPALWAVAHIHPFGTAAYNEIAGGAAGAASLGMERQFWGDNMVAALGAIDAHASTGARVWYQEATFWAVQAYQRDGKLRRDLRWANGPEGADISVYHYHQEFRDKEFTTWTEFHGARPVDGVYLDEVPLIEIYARPGAWR